MVPSGDHTGPKFDARRVRGAFPVPSGFSTKMAPFRLKAIFPFAPGSVAPAGGAVARKDARRARAPASVVVRRPISSS